MQSLEFLKEGASDPLNRDVSMPGIKALRTLPALK